jgi:hypothetical protein
MESNNSSLLPPDFIANKNELCRLSWSLLSQQVKDLIIHENEQIHSENVGVKQQLQPSKHQVTIAEMMVLHTLFKETSTARMISNYNLDIFHGNMKSLVVMEVAKTKKNIYRVSLFTPESCISYLKSPLVMNDDETRPVVIKKSMIRTTKDFSNKQNIDDEENDDVNEEKEEGFMSMTTNISSDNDDNDTEETESVDSGDGPSSSSSVTTSEKPQDVLEEEEESNDGNAKEQEGEEGEGSSNQFQDPKKLLSKTELCRLSWSLLTDEVQKIVSNELNYENNTHPIHEVTIAEMIVLHTIFKVTRAARIITKVNKTQFNGHMKNFVVMEFGRAKKSIHRVSQFTPESCVAYLNSPLVTNEPRPEIIKKSVSELKSKTLHSSSSSYLDNGADDENSSKRGKFESTPPSHENGLSSSSSSNQLQDPESLLSKTELCRLSWSLLTDEVQKIISNELNYENNTHPIHEVTIAEMIVLRTIFRETRAARIISQFNNSKYSGNLKSLIVMEIAKAKKVMPRLSNLESESCIAYLNSPLVSNEPRPEIIKKINLNQQLKRHRLSMQQQQQQQQQSLDMFYDDDDCYLNNNNDIDNDNNSSQILYEHYNMMNSLKLYRNEYQDIYEGDEENNDYNYA